MSYGINTKEYLTKILSDTRVAPYGVFKIDEEITQKDNGDHAILVRIAKDNGFGFRRDHVQSDPITKDRIDEVYEYLLLAIINRGFARSNSVQECDATKLNS